MEHGCPRPVRRSGSDAGDRQLHADMRAVRAP